ncbi:MAG: hypothetical protein K1X89_07990 [Myxococcaceae bacterium]|nr:hypothetical protein [Myxococcaceae bacterium]
MRPTIAGLLAAIVSACSTPGASMDAGAPCTAGTTTVLASDAGRLTVDGDLGSSEGIFDPALVFALDAGVLAYSSVKSLGDIHTRVAVSADHGRTWALAADVNRTQAATLASTDAKECPGGSCSGTVIHEVSSVVFDGDEPDAQRRWKLVSHRYLVKADGTLLYQYGNLALATAPAPQGPWSEATTLIGWPSPTAFSSADAGTLSTSLAGLEDCLVLTEPDLLWRPDAGLDLAAGCVTSGGGGPHIRIELLHSDDHAATFRRVGTLVRPEDVACFFAPGTAVNVNAPDLFVWGGATYVSATPDVVGRGYRGCVVFQLAGPGTAALRQDGGQAARLHQLTVDDGRFSGACTASEGLGALGILLPHATFDTGRHFAIGVTQRLPP